MNKKFIMLILVSFVALSVIPIYSSQTMDPSRGLALSNDYVRFEFEPEGMGLKSMIDLKSGYNHIQTVKGKHLLWEIAYSKGGATIHRKNNNAAPCNTARIENLPDGSQRVVMDWNFLWWPRAKNPVAVQVIIELPKDCGIAQWHVFVENLDDYWGLWEVSCPKINGFPAPGDYDIARPTFAGGGQLLKNWNEKVKERYPSGFWPMQFMSLNHSTNAVYFGSLDPDARAKDFIADPFEQQLVMVHYPDNMGIAGSDYPDYYPVAFGVYQGGWLEAAHRYRPWVLKQKWAQKGPLSQRVDVPDLVKNVGLWIRDSWEWNNASGSYHDMNVPLLEAQKKLGVPLALHWYNWHHNLFDTEYPHYLPPKQGFKERVKELVDNGLLIMPYINGSSIDMSIPDWDKFAPHAIMDESGGYRVFFYGFTNPLLSMCPNQTFWQDQVAILVDSLTGFYGVNSVYLDQIAERGHELCFNKEHGHPIGGGNYFANGNRNLLRKVEYVSQSNERKSVITSEGTDEVFSDVLDANLTWDYPTERHIPLMFVVYSGYKIFFGSQCDHKKSSRFFNLRQGQALIDGRQNGWMDLGLFKPEYADKAEYLRQCGQYRVITKKFLLYGRLWQPIDPINSVPAFTEDDFGWPDFMEGTGLGTKHTGSVPSAEGRLWQSEDGHLGIFLANYVNENIPFSYSIDPAKYGLKEGQYKLAEITPQGIIPLTSVSGIIERTENLESQKIKVIEISPEL